MNLRIGAEQDVWKLLLVLAVGLVAVVAYPARLGYAQAQSLKVTLLGAVWPQHLRGSWRRQIGL